MPANLHGPRLRTASPRRWPGRTSTRGFPDELDSAHLRGRSSAWGIHLSPFGAGRQAYARRTDAIDTKAREPRSCGSCVVELYNFRRPHQGIGGLVPADRYFQAAPEVLRTLKERVAANAAEIARHGTPKEPFYLTGKVGGTPFSVHAEGERVILTRRDGTRQEVDLVPPASGSAPDAMPAPLCPRGQVTSSLAGDGNEEPAAPGVSVLDGAFESEEASEPEEVIDDRADDIDEPTGE